MSAAVQNPKARAAEIIRRIARASSIPLRQVRSPSRKAPIIRARHSAMYLIRELTDLTLAETARPFNRKLGAVLFAVQSIQNRIETDPAFAAWLSNLKSQIANRKS